MHAKFEPGKYFHIIARAIDGINLFRNDENKSFFLRRFQHYIRFYADTYAYCLLDNHVHFLIKPKLVDEIRTYLETIPKEELTITRRKFLEHPEAFDFNELIETQFNYLFVSYVKAFNKVCHRKGGMFIKPFRCIEVRDDFHFTQLIVYIHANVIKHRLARDFTTYYRSSYREIISEGSTFLERDEVLEWFGGKDRFVKVHHEQAKLYYGDRF